MRYTYTVVFFLLCTQDNKESVEKSNNNRTIILFRWGTHTYAKTKLFSTENCIIFDFKFEESARKNLLYYVLLILVCVVSGVVLHVIGKLTRFILHAIYFIINRYLVSAYHHTCLIKLDGLNFILISTVYSH